MKKKILIIGLVLSFSSCSLVGGIVGGGIKAAGSVAGSVIGVAGRLIGGIIGSRNGEIKAKDVKYRFSNAEVSMENGIATVTGQLSHNGPVKNNVLLEIPCQDKDGHELGYAIDRKEKFEKNTKWEFRATIANPEVRTCKMSEAKISEGTTEENIEKTVEPEK